MRGNLLTVPQVAERLQLSRVRIYELIQSGDLGSLKIGRSRRIPEAEVERFIADRLDEAGIA